MGLSYQRGRFKHGLRTSARENSTAYGFSIMITATFAVVSGLNGSPAVWDVFFFAFAAVAGFTLVLGVSTSGFREKTSEAEDTGVLIVAAAFNFVSVLSGLGVGTLVAWVGHGWAVWLVAPAAAAATYLLANGLEYAVAEEEEDA